MYAKKTVFAAALAAAMMAVVPAGNLGAEEKNTDAFFKSAGLFFSMSLASHHETGADRIAISMGIQGNFFIFTGSDFGYYINPLIGIRLHLSPEMETRNDAPRRMDMYMGAAGGPGYYLYHADSIDAFLGAGPDLGITMRLDEGNETDISMGIGFGGTLEGRLNFYRAYGVAAGFSFRYNPAPESESVILSLWPYVGAGF